MLRTALYDRHRSLGAKTVDFHGWEMPLYYTSILDEHKAVRTTIGMFDISHMGQVIVSGEKSAEALDRIMTNDITNLPKGRSCYTLMLNEQGGIIDDLIIYRLGENDFLVIINCGNRVKDVEWMQAHTIEGAAFNNVSDGRSILAIQGPLAGRVLEQILDAKVSGLERFEVAPIRTMGPAACIARTGYTGSDGFELFLPDNHAKKIWDIMIDSVKALGGLPIGLGARDTLRLEAGLRLYGTDLNDTTTPLEAGLKWTVAFEKQDFIGKKALLAQQAEGVKRRLIGIEFAQGPIPREGCPLTTDESAQNGDKPQQVGAITGGTFSSMLNRSIGMAYVEPAFAKIGTRLNMSVRARSYTGTVVKMPFWKPESRKETITSAATPTLENKS